MVRGPALPVFVLVFAAAVVAGDADPIRQDLDLHATFLSSSELGDRAPGEPGLDVAARYIAMELGRLGYSAAGWRGAWEILSPVTMTPEPEDCLLFLRRPEGTKKFVPGRDFRPLAVGGSGIVVAPVILVAGVGDLSESIRGRIVLLFGADEKTIAAAAAWLPAAILVALDPRFDTLDRVTFSDGRTATGFVKDRGTEFLFTDRETGSVTRLTKDMVRQIELDLPPGPPGKAAGEIVAPKPFQAPVLGISAEAAAGILGADPAEALAGIAAGVRPRVSPATGGTVRLVVPNQPRKRTLRIIQGRRAGTDPRASRGIVLVRARYDGADDTAATALALAAEIAAAKPCVRPVFFHFAPRGSGTIPAGVILVSVTGGKRIRKVPVGRPGERAAEVAAVRVAARIVAELANVPLPKPKPRTKPPAPKTVPPPPPKGTVAAARRARLAGRLDSADLELAAALVKTPRDAAVRTELGRVLIARKKWEEAFAQVKEIEALAKTDGRADHLRFEIYEARGESEEAAQALLRAVRAEYPEAMVDWVIRLPMAEPGAGQAARTVLRKLVTKAPESAWGKFAAGLHLYNRRNLPGAERYLGEAVKLDPLLGSAWFWLGKVRSENGGDPVQVARDFDRAAQCGFDFPSVRFERGLCRLRAKMYTLAIREFEAYLKEIPSSSDALYNIACAHALMRNTEAALDWLGRAIEAGFSDPDHARRDPDLASIRDHPRFEALLMSRRTD